MTMIALLRVPGPLLPRCALTHLTRKRIDFACARRQHRGYASTLRKLGAAIEYLPPLPDAPDGAFVEDTALILDEIAVVAQPVTLSRRLETASAEAAAAKHRVTKILGDGEHFDGGDILRIGRRLYVGHSSRTNTDAFVQLRELVEPYGYQLRMIPIDGCLHLKTACTFIPPGFLVANPAWVETRLFNEFDIIPVAATEPFAANTLTLNGTTLVSSAFPETERTLQRLGIKTQAVDISEFHKAEAGLTCLSLLVPPAKTRPPPRPKSAGAAMVAEFTR
jgi:dimethylargininase